MQVLQAQNYLGSIKLGIFLRESILLSKMEEEVASINKIDHEIQAIWRLKCIMKFEYEWERHVKQDLPFPLRRLAHILRHDIALLNRLHCKEFLLVGACLKMMY
jgi:hypothetical protein